MKIDCVHTELDTKFMKINHVHTELDTKIDCVSADFNKFSLDSMQEIKSIYDILHLIHDFMRKVIHFLLYYYFIC